MKDLPHRKKAAYTKVKDGQVVGLQAMAWGDERKALGQGQIGNGI